MLTQAGIAWMIEKPDPVVLDIGANDGEHTQMFLNLFQRANVYSFEPDPRACARYLLRLPRHARAHLVRMAVGAQDGTTMFYSSQGAPSEEWARRLPNGWDLSGSIRRPKAHLVVHPWCSFEPIRVPVTRLDTWTSQHLPGNIDFIWADVQGAEGDLIAGGRDTLSRTQYFYTEYSNHELYEGQPTLEQLREMLPGFDVVKVFENDVLFRNRSWA